MRQTVDTYADMYISPSCSACVRREEYLHIMREVSAFARSTIQGIPEPQAVERATGMALTLSVFYPVNPLSRVGRISNL